MVTVSKLVRKPDTGALRSIEASVKSWTLTGNIYQTIWEGAEHNLARDDDARVCIQERVQLALRGGVHLTPWAPPP